MKMNLGVLIALINLQCIFSSVIDVRANNFGWISPPNFPWEEFGWLSARDFTSEELANLSPQQEHELLLKRFATKEPKFLKMLFAVELFANGIGNDFFELSDEKSGIVNKAIAKAAYQCFTQMRFQDRINRHIETLVQKAQGLVNETGSVSAAYNKVCSKIDEDLKNETMYTTLWDEYKKAPQGAKKTYQYDIPKSEEDLRKSFAELANDPQSKRLNVFHISAFLINAENLYEKKALLELERQPGKGEAVQKIYEETSNEIIPLVKDIRPEEVNMQLPLNVDLKELTYTHREKMLSKINENPNLKDEYKKIYDRVREWYNKNP